VKEPEISQLPSPTPHVSQGPRYRYFSTPPTTVSLCLADLASQIPEAARLPAFDTEHSVELPCEEVFTGPAPKLPLSRLAEIAGEHVCIDGVPDVPIRLPVAQLALAYRFVNGREVLKEEPQSEEMGPKPEKSPNTPEEFAPKAEAPKSTEGSVEPKEDFTSPKGEAATGELKSPAAVVEASVAPPAVTAPEPGAVTPAVDTKLSPEEAKASDTLPPSQEAPLEQENPPAAVRESTLAAQPKPPAPEVWRPIAMFPIFRRKVAEPQVKPPVAPLRPLVEIRKPRAPFVPLEFSAKPVQEATPKTELVDLAVKEPAPAAHQSDAVLVETEHLPKSEPKRPVEILDQDALQAVFMTEEILSVDRVVELCGGLPGIKSCVLAQGAAVLASHNVPESIDLVSLSAHALEMLAAMRQSAARMGVGAVPAVTIHAEKGPITFLHQDDLCLLVMHKDRGFVPGVREKLQLVVEHLSQANPALPAGTSRPVLAPKKTSF